MRDRLGSPFAEDDRAMSAPQSPDAATFAQFIEELPSNLALWGAGGGSFYEVLCRLNIYPVVEQQAMAVREGPHLAAMMLLRRHHNQSGICVAWALRNLPGRPPKVAVRQHDLVAAFDLAGRYWAIKNMMAEVRQGVRTFESQGRRITLAYRGNAVLDTTDRLLDLVDDITSMPQGPPPGMAVLRSWLAGEGRGLPWELVPLLMREELRHFARSVLAGQASYLPPELDVGGFTMADGARVLTELFARAFHAAVSIMQGSSDPEVVLPVRSRTTLIAQLALASGVAVDRVGAIVDLLTTDLDACPDPCLTPLVRLPDGRLAAMSSLITPGAQVRNLTARIQLDPTRFGEAGRKLGLLGSQTVAATLRRRLGTAKVDERIKVFAEGGRQVGDFDVVAFEPATTQVVVFEVVWNIGPDGSAEVAGSERRAHAKRAQVAALRSAIAGGAQPQWPPGWEVPSDATYRWFILTPDVLPALPLEDRGIVVRSHQMLERFRWAGDTVSDMVHALLDPPPPPIGLGSTDWINLRYGPFEVRVESLRS